MKTELDILLDGGEGVGVIRTNGGPTEETRSALLKAVQEVEPLSPLDSKIESHRGQEPSLSSSLGLDVSSNADPNDELSGPIESRRPYDPDRDGFHNPRQPEVQLQSENPAQRMVLVLKMQGLTNIDIAQRTGYTPVHVATICKQPWALDYMARNLHEAGVDKVARIIDKHVIKAVERIITEMDNEKARSQERTNAAKTLIEMKYGKAVQVIEHRNAQDVAAMTDEEIAARLQQLRMQQQN